MVDPNDKKNIDNIKEGIKGQLPSNVFNQAKIYFLRGGINYSHLNLKHKTMMALLYRKVKSMKVEERTPEIDALIETYGKEVNFIEIDSLNPIIDEINSTA